MTLLFRCPLADVYGSFFSRSSAGHRVEARRVHPLHYVALFNRSTTKTFFFVAAHEFTRDARKKNMEHTHMIQSKNHLGIQTRVAHQFT